LLGSEPVGEMPTFHCLIPAPAYIEAAALLDSVDFQPAEPADRPYTLVNFIASADGRATWNGRSGALGDDGDKAIFHGLRERVDAVLAGTVTMTAERYGRILGKADRRERRVERGQTAEPIACLFTRSGQIPAEIPLFAEPEARVVVFYAAGREPELGSPKATVELIALEPGELTLTTAFRRLRRDFGIRSLLCEGGPTLFGALLQESLVDELFLTVAPKLVGGGRAATISDGPELSELAPLELRWVLEREGALYLRYRAGPS
jgi:riboflavin-specific deaminase-like protein